MRRTIFSGSETLFEPLRAFGKPLRGSESLDPLMERIDDARLVLLGEASHGTSDYYVWRHRISRRLVEEKGYQFIAVEGDWPDGYEINRYVKRLTGAGASAREVVYAFDRWPTRMWANWETVALAEWLRRHNENRPLEERVGFYGLDVYSLWESIEAVLRHVEEAHPEHAASVREAYACFQPFARDAQEYAWHTRLAPDDCREEVVEVLLTLLRSRREAPEDAEAHFNAEQNARVAIGAERYYRAMVRGDGESWNVRDIHMMDTLDRLMDRYGPDAKGIVWAHNTHIGDARATDMADAGMLNIGQLARERYGEEQVVLVGFGGYEGSVVAGRAWGAPMERMKVPAAREGSWEELMHRSSPNSTLLISQDFGEGDGFLAPFGHRAIGVVYNPERERHGNYVPSYMMRRYDAFLYFESTRALHPLHIEPRSAHEPPETYPFGE
jgi:erythromycin esterase